MEQSAGFHQQPCPAGIQDNLHLYLRNSLLNLSKYGPPKSIMSIGKIEKAIIVGAGPSLDKVEKLPTDATIFCSDRAWVCMQGRVDVSQQNKFYIVSIDPSPATSGFIPTRLSGVPIIASLKANPETVGRFNNRLFYIPSFGDDYLSNCLGDKNKLPIFPEFGHVVGAAYFIALLLGAEHISFHGCDYSFYGEEIDDYDGKDKIFVCKKYYAAPIKTPISGIRKSDNQCYVLCDYDGEQIPINTYPFKYGDTPGLYTNDLLQHHKRCLDKVKTASEKYLNKKIEIN